ncbi:endonuclease III [bacterium]|nr:MAG: endonuclease III [bacterium]
MRKLKQNSLAQRVLNGYGKLFFSTLNNLLKEHFGEPNRYCENSVDALVRGILSQNTTDKNRDRAFSALKKKFANWCDVLNACDNQIIELIRPAGMANQRVSRIKGLLRWLAENNRGDIDADFLMNIPHKDALEMLLQLNGIGLKTASVFLLFCAGAPYFPVDTHIKRIMVRLGIFPQGTSPETMIIILSQIIPPPLHYSLHLNLIELGRQICSARNARCKICPIRKKCQKIGVK